METLERKTNIKSKITKPSRVIKTSLSPKGKQHKTKNAKVFDLADYLRNSVGYVLGHAAFTK